ncbi:uncharacterized protein LOC127286828 [Leptopilina boulardi]|uniref:uncharacterized protein LOC127286828 n=1 Tax=Leptopilina boulardi TaxID=63433 RepID=UPI0021F5C56C|nr:uncharacterized protein LOC127286828 [Leptopilina boulardi]
MTLIQKTLLLFLVIYYFHGNHALKLQGSAEYLRNDLNLPVGLIDDIENAFNEEFKHAIKRGESKFGTKSNHCQFSQPHERFEEFINSNKQSIENVCKVKKGIKKLLHMKSPCYSNLKSFFREYVNTLIFKEFMNCSNSNKYHKELSNYKKTINSLNKQKNKLFEKIRTRKEKLNTLNEEENLHLNSESVASE